MLGTQADRAQDTCLARYRRYCRLDCIQALLNREGKGVDTSETDQELILRFFALHLAGYRTFSGYHSIGSIVQC